MEEFAPETTPENVPVWEESSFQESVKRREERLRNVLDPVEPFLMQAQSVLVWENPRHSLVMLLAVNSVFWLSTITSYHFLFIASSTVMAVIFLETWKNRIWPEIRVQPIEETEGWTTIHPRLLSVPELCHHISEIWVYTSLYSTTLWTLRQTSPGKFCLLVSSACILLATIGHYISGIMLSYIIVMSILLWPCVVYHNILQKLYIKFEPLMMRMEYKLKIRRHRKHKEKKGAAVEVDHAETDSETETFSPSTDPDITAALARAITDSEDESSVPSRRLSKDPSLEGSDIEDILHRASIDELSLTAGLSSIPAYDSDDDSLYPSLMPTAMPSMSRVEDLDSMHFYPSHFNGNNMDTTSQGDDESLVQGLNFPDISDVLDGTPAQSKQKNTKLGHDDPYNTDDDVPDILQDEEGVVDTTDLLQTLKEKAAVGIMTHALSSMATSTMNALEQISESVKTAVSKTEQSSAQNANIQPESAAVEPVAMETGDDDTVAMATECKLSRQSSKNTDEDLADFDFLEDEDLGNYEPATG